MVGSFKREKTESEKVRYLSKKKNERDKGVVSDAFMRRANPLMARTNSGPHY